MVKILVRLVPSSSIAVAPLRRPVDSGREQGGIYMFVSRPSMTKIVRYTTRLLFTEKKMIDNLVFVLSPSPN